MNSARWLGEFLYRVVPKRRMAVFNGQPDFCDDVLALERVLRDTDLRKLVVLCSTRAGAKDRSRYPGLSPKTVAVPKWTPRGVWYVDDRQVRVLHPLLGHCCAFRTRWNRSTCGTACRSSGWVG